MNEKINKALDLFDPNNSEHWTEEGAPVMDKIHELVGDETVTRQMVTSARSGFTRVTAGENYRDDTGVVGEENSIEHQESKINDAVISGEDYTGVAKFNHAGINADVNESSNNAVNNGEDSLESNVNTIRSEELSQEDVRLRKLGTVKDRIKHCSDEITKMQEELKELYVKEKSLSNGYGGPLSASQNQKAIQHYLKSSHQKKLKDYHERKESLMNVNPNIPPVKSKLDIKMAATNKANRRAAGR